MNMIHFDLIVYVSEFLEEYDYYLLNKPLYETIMMVEKSKYWKQIYDNFFKKINKEYLILNGDYNWKREYMRVRRFNHWSQINNTTKELFICPETDDGSDNWNVIPKEIGNLTNLELIYIRSNIEKIPKEIGNLINLRLLYLVDNKIKEIPREISNLTQLTLLDLTNNLVDNIPEEIDNLPNLRIKLIGKCRNYIMAMDSSLELLLYFSNQKNSQLYEKVESEIEHMEEITPIFLPDGLTHLTFADKFSRPITLPSDVIRQFFTD